MFSHTNGIRSPFIQNFRQTFAQVIISVEEEHYNYQQLAKPIAR